MKGYSSASAQRLPNCKEHKLVFLALRTSLPTKQIAEKLVVVGRKIYSKMRKTQLTLRDEPFIVWAQQVRGNSESLGIDLSDETTKFSVRI